MSDVIKLPVSLDEMKKREMNLEEIQETMITVIEAYNNLVCLVNNVGYSSRDSFLNKRIGIIEG